jgi:hypothetical protein
MNSIEESTANHEIISALVVALGMIGVMMNEIAGLLIILAGTGSIIIIYSYRMFSIAKDIRWIDRSMTIRWFNYLILIAGLSLLITIIFASQGRNFYVAVALAMLVALAAIDLIILRKIRPRVKLSYSLIRIGLIIMLLLLFYFFPVR